MTSRPATLRAFTAGLALAATLLAGCATGAPGAGAVGQAAARQPVNPAAATSPAQTPPKIDPVSKAVPKPAPPTAKPVNHCAANTAAQLVLVSIAQQHVWMCAGTRTVYQSGVTTGMVGQYTSTPTGHYEIQPPSRDTTLTLNTGAQYDVKYWVPFDGPLYGFHDSSWQNIPYGSAMYRTDGSYGCVHLPLAGMKFLYEWVHVGASVDIRA